MSLSPPLCRASGFLGSRSRDSPPEGGSPEETPSGAIRGRAGPFRAPPSAYRAYDVITLREVNLRKNPVDFEQ